MKERWRLFFCIGAAAFIPLLSRAAVVKLEAESAVLGADYTVSNSAGVNYITILSNGTNTSPGTAARVATFTVTFPVAGTYDLYARVRVGSGGANDDSFFYGNGFGNKAPANAADWILFNNLTVGGFTNSTDTVSGSGSAGVSVWKWLNLSEFSNGSSEAPVAFTVPGGALTQTFQIGAREDGFDVDAIVFGTSTYTFTVANLDAGADGSPPSIITGASTVNWIDVRQRIDGFGASSAWRSTWNTSVADMFFSTNTGIGLSLLRTRIAPGGTTVENTIMQMARDRGAKVWSSPWTPSPVTQFKTANANGVTNLNGGGFAGSAANYQAYANQLAGYVVNMKNAYGVTLYALSIQNEPDFNTTNYESCVWTAQQIHDFVPYLSAALTANNVGATKIVLPESESWNSGPGLYNTTMNDSNVAPLVGVIANHNYVSDNNNGDQTTPAALNSFGKALWETEVSTFNPFDGGITNGIYWAKRVHLFLTSAQLNAYHYWWLSASGTDNSGLASNTDVLAKRGYVLGQFSRFVRPNYYRIGAVTPSGGALVSGFKDPITSRFVVVAINTSGNLIDQTITLSNFSGVSSVTPWITSATQSLASQPSVTVSNLSFFFQLPAMSVVTFVGQAANTPPSLATIADRTINAGVTLVITNAAVDPDLPQQTLTFSLLNAPANATLNSSNGVFTWRPFVSQAGTTNGITVKVADNGSPGQSDTNTFTVRVNPLNPPGFSSIDVGVAQVNLVAGGDAGPDYQLWTSTNLSDWQLLLTTNPAALPVTFSVTNAAEPQRFYRIQLAP